jgi:glutamyl-tRNA reductase
MPLHCLGLNHRSAPLAALEQAHLTPDLVVGALQRISRPAEQPSGPPLEMALLSTCNRVELYTWQDDRHDDESRLVSTLAQAAGLEPSQLEAHLYHYTDSQAAWHLLRVAAGLDSMVVGEPQVLGQVSQAYELALEAGSAGLVVNRLFQSAIQAGKRARAETGIATNPSTTSSVAVRFAASVVADLAGSKVAVLGAGEMAILAVEALRKHGVSDLMVINRTGPRAQELAERWHARAQPLEALPSALTWADILITSTGAPQPILGVELVKQAMDPRPNRPLVLLDTAMPRDVDPAVGELPGVHLYDLEHLGNHLNNSLARRHDETPAVEAILRQELLAFETWLETMAVRPLIAQLHQKAEAVRLQELERTLVRLGNLEPMQRGVIEAMSRSLVKRLLHAPTIRLKESSLNGRSDELETVVRHLFDLDHDDRMPGEDEEGSDDRG